jgi:hypothetical protein
MKSERLSVNTKLSFCKAFIRSVTTHAWATWEFAADSYLFKLQRLQNKVLLTFGN